MNTTGEAHLGMKSASDDRVSGRTTGDNPFPETAAKIKAVWPATGSFITNGVALSMSAKVVF